MRMDLIVISHWCVLLIKIIPAQIGDKIYFIHELQILASWNITSNQWKWFTLIDDRGFFNITKNDKLLNH